MTAYFSSQKCIFFKKRHDGGFQTSHCDHTASPIMLFISRYYSDDATVDYPFVVEVGDGKGGVVSRTTQISSHKYECWLGGGYFCNFRGVIIHKWFIKTNTGSIIQRQGDNFSDAVDSKGGVGYSNTKFSYQKGYFGRVRQYRGFISSQCNFTAPPMSSSFSKYYLVGALDVSTFCCWCWWWKR